jgi:hypothetical protein
VNTIRGRGPRSGPGPSFCLYSHKGLEGAFSEVCMQGLGYNRVRTSKFWAVAATQAHSLATTSCGVHKDAMRRWLLRAPCCGQGVYRALANSTRAVPPSASRARKRSSGLFVKLQRYGHLNLWSRCEVFGSAASRTSGTYLAAYCNRNSQRRPSGAESFPQEGG